jgi:hypothetical protein
MCHKGKTACPVVPLCRAEVFPNSDPVKFVLYLWDTGHPEEKSQNKLLPWGNIITYLLACSESWPTDQTSWYRITTLAHYIMCSPWYLSSMTIKLCIDLLTFYIILEITSKQISIKTPARDIDVSLKYTKEWGCCIVQWCFQAPLHLRLFGSIFYFYCFSCGSLSPKEIFCRP